MKKKIIQIVSLTLMQLAICACCCVHGMKNQPPPKRYYTPEGPRIDFTDIELI